MTKQLVVAILMLALHPYGPSPGGAEREAHAATASQASANPYSLPFSSYLGGARDDAITAVAADGAGNIYLAGWTNSANWPVQMPIQPVYAGPEEGCLFFSTTPCGDAFVAKLDRHKRLVYSTYLGGPGIDYATAIEIDKAGAVYVAGGAGPGFPVHRAIQPAHGGGECPAGRRRLACGDAFLAKIDPAGTALLFSTYLGGEAADGAAALALDGGGDVYVTGFAGPGFPLIGSARTFGGGTCAESGQERPCSDAFVSKLSGDGSQLRSSTVVGGDRDDVAADIAIDRDGTAYVTGSTRGDFPLQGPLGRRHGGGECVVTALPLTMQPCRDAFVAGISPDASSLVYSTYLGAAADDTGNAIDLDPSGNVYVTGAAGPGWPTARAAQRAHGGGNCPVARDPAFPKPCSDAFLMKLRPDRSRLAYSTFLGGPAADAGEALVVDRRGNALLAGSAGEGLPQEGLQALGGKTDAMLATFGPKGALVRVSYLGGSGRESAAAAADPFGRMFVAGNTDSRSDFPVAAALQDPGGGQVDGFVAEITTRAGRSPHIQQLVPRTGSSRGATRVTIKGAQLSPAGRVRFGTRDARVESADEEGTRLTVVAPGGPPGPVPVTVSSEEGRDSGPVPGATFTLGAGEWRSIPGPMRYQHTATLLPAGKVLVAGGCRRVEASGGCREGVALRSVLSFDPRTNRWSRAGNLKSARWGHSAVPVPAGPRSQCGSTCGKIVFLGGFERRLTAEVFDPSTGRSESLPATADERLGTGHTATLLPSGPVSVCGQNCGKLLVAVRSHSFTTPAELLDLSGQEWESVGRRPEPAVGNDPTNTLRTARSPTRSQHSASLLPNGQVLLLGGVSSASTSAAEPLAPTELFDPLSGSFLPATDPGTYRYAGHTATVLEDAKVLLAGGLTDNIGTLTSSVEVYAPESTGGLGGRPEGVWEPRSSLPRTPRSGHAAISLPDGRVLLVGGSDSVGEPRGDGLTGGGLSTAELFDPASGRWQSAGRLQHRREALVLFQGFSTFVRPSFTATPLADGRALVVGGGPGGPEIYYPAGMTVPRRTDGRTGGVPPWAIGAFGGAVLAALATVLAFRMTRKPSKAGK